MLPTSRHARFAAMLAAGSALALTTPLYAQSADTTVEPSVAADDGGLADIVVTAQKRAESLQNVPITITAITSDTLSAAGVDSSASIAALAPGVVITATPAVPAIYIRGVGTQNTSPGDEGSNSLYVDGVYYAASPAMLFSFNNIERIEVLKGPQGTLFGRNATGGLIHVITRDPSFDPMFKGSIGYANYNRVDGSAYVSTGVTDTLAVDTAVSFYNQSDGWGKNLLSGRDVYKGNSVAVRSKILWEPSETTRILLAGDYSYSHDSFSTPRSVPPGSIDRAGETYTGRRYDIRGNHEPESSVSTGGGSLRVEQGVGFGEIVSISAYRSSTMRLHYDQDGTSLNFSDIRYVQPEHQFTQELQLQSNADSRIQWIVGGFYLKSQSQVDPLTFKGTTITPLGGLRELYATLDSRSIAGFAQATVPVTDTTNITAGARYTKDKRHLTGFYFQPFSPNQIVQPTDVGAKYSKFTYRLAIDQKLTPDILAYASLSRGFKAGVFNTTNLANPPARPETLDAYEAGVKSELFDRKLRLNVSAFLYKYKDIQLNQVQGAVNFLFNAARAETYGLDLDLLAAPTRNLTLRASANYLHGRYESFPGAPATIPALTNGAATPVPPGYSCNPPASAVGGNRSCVIADASGNTTLRTPKFTYTVGADYTYPTEHGDFGASVTWYHNSGFFFEADNRLRQNGYGLLSGQISWRSPDEKFGLRFWGRNLTNSTYYVNLSSSAGDNATVQAPRTYGVTFDLSY